MIEPLSSLWFFGIGISVVVVFTVIQIGTRIPPDKRRILMVTIGIAMIFAEVLQNVYLYKLGLWSLHSSLPVHLCGVAGLIAGVIMIKPKQDGFEFLALIGFPGALHAILTPQLNHGDMPFLVFKYYLVHIGIILIPLFLSIVQGYRVRDLSWLRVILMCQLLMVILGAFNYFSGSNYMYLCERPIVNNPMIIGEWPWYIIGFEILGIIHILAFYAGFKTMRPLPY